MHSRRLARTLATAAAAAALLSAVVGASAQAQGMGPSGVLNLGFTSDIHSLDPTQQADTQSAVPISAIYNTLLTYNHQSKIVPDLVASWDIKDGGKLYILHLRHGVVFSNGDPFNATDVVDALVRDMTPKTADPYGFALSAVEGYSAFQKKPTGVPKGITAPNPYTVDIQLTQPQGFFLNVLALPSIGAIPDPAVVAKYGQSYTNHPVGTGAFMVSAYTPEHSLTLVPNPHYWGPKPKVAKVNMYFNLSAETGLLEFERGQLDVFPAAMQFELPSADYLAAMANPALKAQYHRAPVVGISFVFLNEQLVPAFKSLLVRQAINYAVSKIALLRTFNGRGLAATQVLPPGMPGYQPSIKGYPYNPAKAKELLAKAGYKNGFSVTFWTPSDPNYLNPAQVIASELGQVGVKVTLKTMTLATYESGMSANKIPMGFEYWTEDYPDPQDFLYYMLDPSGINGNGNFANWVNNKFTALERKANAMPATQNAARYKLYEQADQIAVQQAPWLFGWFPVQDALISSHLSPSPSKDLEDYLNPNLPLNLDVISKS
jgi:oligopeptide transport system substrate-binding protein